MKRIDVRELELSQHSITRAIHELDRRGSHMTPEDQRRATELKKKRLAMKDRLLAVRTLGAR